MAEKQIMVKIDHVSKEYRLGAIGGTTLREDLERFHAKIRKKEDPTLKIGQKTPEYGKRFMALKDISFEVEKGEAVGIIGHNGAGKSTLLKLLSRVTAPTKGSIGMNGRVASMLEVGTGFHPELYEWGNIGDEPCRNRRKTGSDYCIFRMWRVYRYACKTIFQWDVC